MSKTVVYNAEKENRKGARSFVFSNGTGIFLNEGENIVADEDYDNLIKNTEYAVLSENGIIEEKGQTAEAPNVETSKSQVISDIKEIDENGKTEKTEEVEPEPEQEKPPTNVQSVKVKKGTV